MPFDESTAKQFHNTADLMTYLAEMSFISGNFKDMYELSPTYLSELLTATHTMYSKIAKGIRNITTTGNYFLIAMENSTTKMDLTPIYVDGNEDKGCQFWKAYSLDSAITAGTKVTSIGAYGSGKTVVTLNNVASGTFYAFMLHTSVASKVACNNNLALINGSAFEVTAGLPAGCHILLVRGGATASPTIDIFAASDPGLGAANTLTLFIPLTPVTAWKYKVMMPV